MKAWVAQLGHNNQTPLSKGDRRPMANSILSNVYLFKGLNSEELNQITQIAKLDTYGMGDLVFSQGERATAMYVIKHGSIRVKHSTASGEEVEVSVLGTGAHFGEMAFVGSSERTATAQVTERSEIIRIDFDKLKALLELNSKIAAVFYKALTHFLVARLSDTTKDLSFAREKIRSHG